MAELAELRSTHRSGIGRPSLLSLPEAFGILLAAFLCLHEVPRLWRTRLHYRALSMCLIVCHHRNDTSAIAHPTLLVSIGRNRGRVRLNNVPKGHSWLCCTTTARPCTGHVKAKEACRLLLPSPPFLVASLLVCKLSHGFLCTSLGKN